MNSFSMWNFNNLKFVPQSSPYFPCRTTFHIKYSTWTLTIPTCISHMTLTQEIPWLNTWWLTAQDKYRSGSWSTTSLRDVGGPAHNIWACFKAAMSKNLIALRKFIQGIILHCLKRVLPSCEIWDFHSGVTIQRSFGLWHHAAVGYQWFGGTCCTTSPWRWRQQGPLKCGYPTTALCDVTTQETSTREVLS